MADENERREAESGPAAATVRMEDPWPSRIQGGWPTLPFDEAPDELKRMDDGAVAVLADPAMRKLGFGLVDRQNNVVRLIPALPKEELDEAFFTRRVEKAFEHRRRMRLTGSRSAFRLIHGEGDGLSGFYLDVFAGHAVVWTLSTAFDRFAELLGIAAATKLKLECVIHKTRPPGPTPTGRIGFRLLFGSEPPRELLVEERGMRYEVHLTGGVNSGLFCDMRDVRSAIARMSRGLRVLNTFCYSGSISTVAAANGARQVTSVDYAAGVLAWAKANFVHNGLDPADRNYRFVKADVFEFLKHERRKDHGYNMIVLDPPASTNVPGRRWFLKSDYDRLIGHALGVLDRFGYLLAAASSLETRPEGIEQQIRAAARDRNRRLRLIESFAMPPDFPTQMIYPANRHLKCFLLQADV